MQVAELFRPVLGDEAPVAIRAYDGSASTPSAAEPVATVDVRSETALAYLAASPNSLGLARAYVSGHLDVEGSLYQALTAMSELTVSDVTPSTLLRMAARMAPLRFRHRVAPPPEEHRQHGRRHSKDRDSTAIEHHYDVSNRFYELVLGPSMAYTCAVYPSETATLEDAQFAKHALVAREARPPARDAAARRRLRLGPDGDARRRAPRRAGARRHPLARPGDLGAEGGRAPGARRPRRDPALRLPRRLRGRLRRGQLDRAHRAHRAPQHLVVLPVPATRSSARAGACSTTASPGPTTTTVPRPTRSSTATSSRTASCCRSAG